MSAPLTRQTARSIVEYTERVTKDGDYTPPSESTLVGMSTLIDQSMERSWNSQRTSLSNSKTIEREVRDLSKGPRTCGGFVSPKSVVMKDRTPLEQMAVFDSWMSSHTPKKVHTFAFSAPNAGHIPVRVNVRKGNTSLMMTMLGTSKRAKNKDLRAPVYHNWHENDPMASNQKDFVGPLVALEAFRQPHCLGSLFMKSTNVMKSKRGITHNERYQVYESGSDGAFCKRASVEIPGQSKSAAKKIKAQSAGYFLSERVASRHRERNLFPVLKWEEVFSEDESKGYKDYNRPSVTPIQVVKTFSSAVKGDTSELDALCGKFAAMQFTGSQLKEVNDNLAKTLFEEDDDEEIPEID